MNNPLEIQHQWADELLTPHQPKARFVYSHQPKSTTQSQQSTISHEEGGTRGPRSRPFVLEDPAYKHGTPVEVYQHNWHHTPVSISREAQEHQLSTDDLNVSPHDPYSDKILVTTLLNARDLKYSPPKADEAFLKNK